MQRLNCIFQTIQYRINFLATNIQRRLNANNARIVKHAGNQYTTLEETSSDFITDIVVDKVHANEQTFSGDLSVDAGIACSNHLQLRDKVFALLSSLLYDMLFQCYINCSNSSCTGDGVTTRG